MARSFEYEFFGPVGTFACTSLLPVVVYALSYLVNARGCFKLSDLTVPGWSDETVLFSWQAVFVVYAWFAFQLLLHVALPGRYKEGVVEADGSRWRYKLNGSLNFSLNFGLKALCVLPWAPPCRAYLTAECHAALQNFVLTYGAIFVLAFVLDVLPLHWVAEHHLELLTASTIFSISLSVALYCTSFRVGAVLAPSGTSGCPSYDFWMGREMNPRPAGIDLKEFCELYPGLMGWMVLNLAMAHKQLEATGQVSTAMVLINVFQLIYVCDALWFEPSILSTMDITSEGFGYMLAFGDLTWVPFVYSIQARYLMDHTQDLTSGLWILWLLAVLALKALGYSMFRGANSQKDLFRSNPDDPRVASLQTISTERGTRLICSSWWGIARHVNYTGDWIMSLAWCMLCGTDCIVPYFYAAYFGVLLLHRDRRDDHACSIKYGRDWAKYCQKVPYRLVPYIY